jgi:hypothetical protein
MALAALGETIVPVDSLKDVILGAGYDGLEDLLSDAIVAVPSRDVPTEGYPRGGQRINVDIDVIEDTQALRETLNVSATAAARGLTGGGSVSYKLFSEVEINSNDVFALIFVSVVNETVSILDPRLSKIAKDEWNSQAVSLRRYAFISAFGDSYVSSITTGGQFLALFRLHASSRREKEEVTISAKASFSSFRAEGNYDKVKEFFATHTHTTTSLQRNGGAGPYPNADIESLLRAAQEFPDLVNPDKGGKPVKIFFSAKSISKIPDPSTNIDLSAGPAANMIEDLAELQEKISDRLNDARFARDFPDLFPQAEIVEIEHTVTELETARKDVSRFCEKISSRRFETMPPSAPVQLKLLPVPPRVGKGEVLPIRVKLATEFGLNLEGIGGEWLLLPDDSLLGFTAEWEPLPTGTSLEYCVGGRSGP